MENLPHQILIIQVYQRTTIILNHGGPPKTNAYCFYIPREFQIF